MPAAGNEPPQRVEIVISTRTVLRVLAIAFAFLALLYLLYLVRSVLVLILISTFLAISINPLVTLVERKLRLSRGPAVVLVFLTLLILFGAFLTALLTPLYNEVRQFAENVPDYLQQLQDSRLFRDLDREYDILDKLQAQAEDLPSRLPDTAGSLLGLAGAVFSAILTFVTVMFLTVFILLELPALGRSLLGLLYPDSADARTASRPTSTSPSRAGSRAPSSWPPSRASRCTSPAPSWASRSRSCWRCSWRCSTWFR